jgi:hypothetical protein
MMTVMLYIHQPADQPPLMVVVNQGNGTGDFSVFTPLPFNQDILDYFKSPLTVRGGCDKSSKTV